MRYLGCSVRCQMIYVLVYFLIMLSPEFAYVLVSSLLGIVQILQKKCNLFNGDCILSESEPFYTNETCSFIEDPQNCIKNGRLVINIALGLIGDSISRNHVHSLLCMLSTVEKVVLVYHDQTFKTRTWIYLYRLNYLVSFTC